MKAGFPLQAEFERRAVTAERMIIVGSAGAGKTRLALALGQLRGLPVIHGDKVFWRPGWTDPDNNVFRDDIARLTAADAWIYDGNLGRVADIVLPRAQAVIWIEQPLYLAALRAYGRTFKHLGRTRPDVGEGCPEQISLSLWGYVSGFNKRLKPRIENWIREFAPQIPVVFLRGDRQVASFLDLCAGSGTHRPVSPDADRAST